MSFRFRAAPLLFALLLAVGACAHAPKRFWEIRPLPQSPLGKDASVVFVAAPRRTISQFTVSPNGKLVLYLSRDRNDPRAPQHIVGRMPDGKEWLVYDGGPENAVYAFAVAKSGAVYVSTLKDGLFRLDTDSGARTPISSLRTNFIVVSPDDHTLAVNSAALTSAAGGSPYDSKVGLMPVTGETPPRPVRDGMAAAFSPDGKTLAIIDATQPPALSVVAPDGAGQRLVEWAVEPSWSPAGKWLAFIRNADLMQVVVIDPLAPEQQHAIYTPASRPILRNPLWASDGFIYFVSEFANAPDRLERVRFAP